MIRPMDNPARMTFMKAMDYDSDILIVGGGLNGPALALPLAQKGLKVCVIDALPETVRKLLEATQAKA